MIQVKIKNLSNVQTHGADFATQELADAWIAQQKSKGINCAWGRPAWTETHDSDGVELETPIEHEDQFTIEQTDVTAQYALADAKAQFQAAKSFGVSLVADFSLENVILEISNIESDAVLSKMSGVLEALSNGYLETAILRSKGIDSGDYDSEFITEARLLEYVNKIETFLGITLSETL